MIRRLIRFASFRDCKITYKLSVVVFMMVYLVLFQWSTQDMTSAPEESPKHRVYVMPSSTPGYHETHPFTYALPYNRSIKGLEFNVDPVLLKHLLVPRDKFITLTLDNVEDFVFATGSSAAFYPLLLDAVASIQFHRPKNKILVYDLGLDPNQQARVKTWCNVIYKEFNFTNVPAHVKNLGTYSWKPLVILDVLKHYPGVLWMDTSVRVVMSNFTGLFHDIVNTKGGIALTTSGHSTFAATHPRMYDYLPTDMEAIKREEQREATLMFYRTQEMYDNVLRWLAMCALEEDCIAPTNIRGCDFQGDNRRRWGYCHRFDQSAVNILFSNYFGHNSWNYYAKSRVVKIERYSAGEFRLQNKNCKPKSNKMTIKATIRKGRIHLPTAVYRKFDKHFAIKSALKKKPFPLEH